MSGTQRRRNEGAAEERRGKEGKIDGKEKEDKGGGKGNKAHKANDASSW